MRRNYYTTAHPSYSFDTQPKYGVSASTDVRVLAVDVGDVRERARLDESGGAGWTVAAIH